METNLRHALRLKLATVPGCWDNYRRPIILINVPVKQNNVDGKTKSDFDLILNYLSSLYNSNSLQNGLTLLLNGLDYKCYKELKSVIKLVNNTATKDVVNQIIVTKSDALLDSHKLENCAKTGDHQIPVHFVSRTRLSKYIDFEQIPLEFGGSWIYNHQEWIKIREKIEDFRNRSKYCLDEFYQVQICIEEIYSINPSEVHQTDRARVHDIFDSAITFANTIQQIGSNLLREINNYFKIHKNGNGSLTLKPIDLSDAFKQIEKKMEEISEVQVFLETLLIKTETNYEEAKEISYVKNGIKSVIEWIVGPGEELANRQLSVGHDVASAEELRNHHEQLELKCVDTYSHYADLNYRLNDILNKHENDNKFIELRSQQDFMNFLCRSFAMRLEKRRVLLIISLKFFRLVANYFDKTSEVFESLVMKSNIDCFEEVNTNLEQLVEQQMKLELIEKELTSEGEKLIGSLSTPLKNTLGLDIIADYEEDKAIVRDVLDATNARKNIFTDSVNVQKVLLEKIKCVYTYENDARQALQWLDELLLAFLKSYSEIGCHEMEIQKENQDLQKFQEVIKNTYSYGCQLLDAALLLRQSCKVETEPNLELSAQLRQCFNQLEDMYQEQMTRLRVTAVFHRSIHDYCLELKNLCEAVNELPSENVQKKRVKVQSYLSKREHLMMEVGRTVRLGKLLKTKLKDSICNDLSDDLRNEIQLSNELNDSNQTAIESISERLVIVTELAEQLDMALRGAQQDCELTSTSPSNLLQPPSVNKMFEASGSGSNPGAEEWFTKPADVDDLKSDDEFITASECTAQSRSSSFHTSSECGALSPWWEVDKNSGVFQDKDSQKKRLVLAVGLPELPDPKCSMPSTTYCPPKKILHEVTETTHLKVEHTHSLGVSSYVLTSETIENSDGNSNDVKYQSTCQNESYTRYKDVNGSYAEPGYTAVAQENEVDQKTNNFMDDELIRQIKECDGWIQLKIFETEPCIALLANTLKEALDLQKTHNDVLAQLQSKKSPVEELLKQADHLIMIQHPRAEVYEAMAESLSKAWNEINFYLKCRKEIIDLNVLFHSKADECKLYMSELEDACRNTVISIDVDTIKKFLTDNHELKKLILETLNGALQQGNSLLVKLNELYSEGSLDSRVDKIKPQCKTAISTVEKWIENLHDRRQMLEQSWSERKQQLNQCLALAVLMKDLNEVDHQLSEQETQFNRDHSLGNNVIEAEKSLRLNEDLNNEAKQLQERALKITKAVEILLTNSTFIKDESTEVAYRILDRASTLISHIDHKNQQLEKTIQFYKLSETALKKLETIELQLKDTQITVSPSEMVLYEQINENLKEITTAPLTMGYEILTEYHSGDKAVQGIQNVVEQLEHRKQHLYDLCGQHCGKTKKIFDELTDYLQQLSEFDVWINNTRKLAGSTQFVGNDIQGVNNFRKLHEGLLNEINEKGTQINSLLLNLQKLVIYLDDNQRHDVDNRVEALHVNWADLKNFVEGRLEIMQTCVKFFSIVDQFNDEMTQFEQRLDASSVSDDNKKELGSLWINIQPMYEDCKLFGQQFLDDDSKMQNGQFESSQNIEMAKNLIDKIDNRYKSTSKAWNEWLNSFERQNEIKREIDVSEIKSQEITKRARSLVSKLYPIITSTSDNLTLVNSEIESNLQKNVNELRQIKQLLIDQIKTSEILKSNATTKPNESQLNKILDDLYDCNTTVHQSAANYEELTQNIMSYFDQILKLEIQKNSLEVKYQLESIPEDLQEIERSKIEHESSKKQVLDVFKKLQNDCDHLVRSIRQQEPTEVSEDDVEKIANCVNQTRNQFEILWQKNAYNILQQKELSQFNCDLHQINNVLDNLSSQLDSIKGNLGYSLRDAKETSTTFAEFEKTFSVIEDRIKTFIRTGETMLHNKHTQSPRIETEIEQLNNKWQEVREKAQNTRKYIDLSVKYFKLIEEAKNWFEEGGKVLYQIANKAKFVKKSEEVNELLNELEIFLKPGENKQDDRIREILELSEQLYIDGLHADEVVKENTEFLDSLVALNNDLNSLAMNLRKAEEKEKQVALQIAKEKEEMEEKQRLEQLKKSEEEKERQKQEAERERRRKEAEEKERLQKIAEEERLRKDEEKRELLRIEAEEKERIEAEENERQRLEAEEAERQKLEAEDRERKRQEAERVKEEELRKQAEEKERQRLAAEEQERRKLEAQRLKEEQLRKEAAEKERQRLAAEEQERQRLEAQRLMEEELRTEAAEKERQRLAAEEQERQKLEAQRLKEEELRKQAEEKERQRLAAEEQERQKLEAQRLKEEQLRKEAAEKERQRLAAEEQERQRLEAKRLKEEELRKQAEEKERKRLAAEEQERQKLEAQRLEEEQLRKDAEEKERQRLVAEEQKRQTQDTERLKEEKEQQKLKAEYELTKRHIAVVQNLPTMCDVQSVSKEVRYESSVRTSYSVFEAGPDMNVNRFEEVAIEKGQSPIIVKPLPNIVTEPGDTVTLTCEISGQPAPEIKLYHGSEIIKQDEHHKVAIQNNVISITIPNVSASDVGNYSVIAENRYGKVQTISNVIVIEKEPSRPDETVPVFLTSLNNIEVNEGEPTTLECTITGHPEPEVIWFYNGFPIKESENYQLIFVNDKCSLNIKKTKVGDAGEYRVKAINNKGEACSSCHLKVQRKIEEVKKSPPIFIKILSDLTIIEGSELELHCQVLGEPTPSLQWFKDGVKINNNDRCKITMTAQGLTNLKITRTRQEDAGVYSLQASNSVDTKTSACHITINNPGFLPIFQKHLPHHVVFEKESVEFQCVITGTPKPNVRWYINGKAPRDGDVTINNIENVYTLRIENVLLGHQGVITCTAENINGEVQSVGKLTVKSLEKDTPQIADQVFIAEPGTLENTYLSTSSTQSKSMIVSKTCFSPVPSSASTKETKTFETVQPAIKGRKSVPPQFISPLVGKIVTPGADVILEGTYTGFPKPQVKWEKNNVEIESDAKVKITNGPNSVRLEIENITNTESGRYSCTLTNESGSVTSTADIVVKKKTFPPVFGRRLQAQLVKKGDRVIMEVEVTGTPDPDITWFKDDEVITFNNLDYHIKKQGSSHSLIIAKADQKYNGKYMVKAENSAGVAQSFADFAVFEPPPEAMTEVIKTTVFEDIQDNENFVEQKLEHREFKKEIVQQQYQVQESKSQTYEKYQQQKERVASPAFILDKPHIIKTIPTVVSSNIQESVVTKTNVEHPRVVKEHKHIIEQQSVKETKPQVDLSNQSNFSTETIFVESSFGTKKEQQQPLVIEKGEPPVFLNTSSLQKSEYSSPISYSNESSTYEKQSQPNAELLTEIHEKDSFYSENTPNSLYTSSIKKITKEEHKESFAPVYRPHSAGRPLSPKPSAEALQMEKLWTQRSYADTQPISSTFESTQTKDIRQETFVKQDSEPTVEYSSIPFSDSLSVFKSYQQPEQTEYKKFSDFKQENYSQMIQTKPYVFEMPEKQITEEKREKPEQATIDFTPIPFSNTLSKFQKYMEESQSQSQYNISTFSRNEELQAPKMVKQLTPKQEEPAFLFNNTPPATAPQEVEFSSYSAASSKQSEEIFKSSTTMETTGKTFKQVKPSTPIFSPVSPVVPAMAIITPSDKRNILESKIEEKKSSFVKVEELHGKEIPKVEIQQSTKSSEHNYPIYPVAPKFQSVASPVSVRAPSIPCTYVAEATVQQPKIKTYQNETSQNFFASQCFVRSKSLEPTKKMYQSVDFDKQSRNETFFEPVGLKPGSPPLFLHTPNPKKFHCESGYITDTDEPSYSYKAEEKKKSAASTWCESVQKQEEPPNPIPRKSSISEKVHKYEAFKSSEPIQANKRISYEKQSKFSKSGSYQKTSTSSTLVRIPDDKRTFKPIPQFEAKAVVPYGQADSIDLKPGSPPEIRYAAKPQPILLSDSSPANQVLFFKSVTYGPDYKQTENVVVNKDSNKSVIQETTQTIHINDFKNQQFNKNLTVSKPKHFVPCDFAESDYESEWENTKIRPIWLPSDSEVDEPRYKKVKPPSRKLRSTSVPTHQETEVHTYQGESQQSASSQINTQTSKFCNNQSYNQYRQQHVRYQDTPNKAVRSIYLQQEAQPEYRFAPDTAMTSGAKKIASNYVNSMKNTFKTKTKQFSRDVMKDVGVRSKSEDRAHNTPQYYKEDSRVAQYGKKHVDPDTGLIYFKYDFGYEFGVVLPGVKSKDAPHDGKVKKQTKRYSDIIIPIQHETTKPKKLYNRYSKWDPASESDVSEWEQETMRRRRSLPYYDNNFLTAVQSPSPTSNSPSLPSTSPKPPTGILRETPSSVASISPSYQSFNSRSTKECGHPPMFITPLKDIAVSSGQTARFECIVQSDGNATIIWTKNGQILTTNHEFQIYYKNGVCRLTIAKAFTVHGGTYNCTATNSIGTACTSATLQVQTDRRYSYTGGF